MIFPLSSGQTGAILTIVSSGTGTITVSNTTLGKSYSKSVTAGDSAVFKGLKTGTWTVKLTNGTQTSTKTVVITSDYSTNIAYFSASINITYPANSTCTVKNSSGQTVASNSNTTSSTKTWTATVNAKGAYTVIATATDGSGKSKSRDVSIASDGQSVSVSLNYQFMLFSDGVAAPELGEFSIYSSSGNSGLSDGLLKIGGDTYSKDNLAFQGAINPVSLGYKTLFVEVSTSSKGCTFGFSSDSTTKSGAPTWVASGTFEKGLTDAVASCPVDAVNTDSYLRIRSLGGGSRSYDYISKIWLE